MYVQISWSNIARVIYQTSSWERTNVGRGRDAWDFQYKTSINIHGIINGAAWENLSVTRLSTFLFHSGLPQSRIILSRFYSCLLSMHRHETSFPFYILPLKRNCIVTGRRSSSTENLSHSKDDMETHWKMLLNQQTKLALLWLPNFKEILQLSLAITSMWLPNFKEILQLSLAITFCWSLDK